MNKRGMVLIIGYLVIVALSFLAGAYLLRSVSERSVVSKSFDSTKALWLAEAGVNRVLYELRANGFSASGPWEGSLSTGSYRVTLGSEVDYIRTLTATGTVPSEGSASETERIIVATVTKHIPAGFYDNAIYAGGDLLRKGNVTGTVIYAGEATGQYKDPQPTSEIRDPSIGSPFPLLNFKELKAKSIQQGNYHDAQHLSGPFPSSFWYEPGIPNIVFLDGDLNLNGSDRVAGFFVVGGGGDVVYDATISGNAVIDGCIYTRGNLTNNGGGGAEVNLKGLWVGGTTDLGGSSVIAFDATYMDAIESKLDITGDVQITSWREN